MFLCSFSCMTHVHTWRDSPVVCFHIHILISPIPMTYELYFIHFDFSCLYSSGHACHMTRALLSISYSYTFVLALLTIYRLSHLTVVYESHFLSSCHRHLVQCSIHPSLIYTASPCGGYQPSAS